MRVPFSYLGRQFAAIDGYLSDIKALVESGDFTLGKALHEFEQRFAGLCQMPYAIGVGSGTDALTLSLKLLGIGPGDEVITTPTTFIATVGAIVMTGARPVFVDSDAGFVIEATQIEAAITPRTRAIVPVHYTGNMADMPAIMAVAQRYGLHVVEDACQAVTAAIDDQYAGAWGATACFSLHPLKNLNVWGDGGVIVTRSAALAEKLRLYRNHGLANRDAAVMFGANCRLDTLQAVIGNRLITQVPAITAQRIANAKRLDEAFANMPEAIRIPPRRAGVKHVYHLYMLRVQQRDALLHYLHHHGIEAKIHYPTPVHLQPAARCLGYQAGDFPVSEADSRCIITLPAHEHLTEAELDYMVAHVRAFYRGSWR
jgi:dTDP-4-amino-4,6-dideoxygalactose transaminase